MVAAAVGIGSAVAGLAGSAMSSNASKSAANTQAAAADRASQLQMQQFQQMQGNLQPYMQAGQAGLSGLMGILGLPGGNTSGPIGQLANRLNTPFSFNPSDLENTPGYQFTLQQALKAMNNQNSAQGLGLSGAQEKGLMQYATGLANQTYGDQYNRALQQFTANYGLASDQANRLAALAGLGQNAAAGVGNAGIQTGSNIGNLMAGAANAQAAGQIGSANAINAGLGSLSNSGMLYAMLRGNNPSVAAPSSSGGIYGGDTGNGFGMGDQFAGYA